MLMSQYYSPRRVASIYEGALRIMNIFNAVSTLKDQLNIHP